VPGDVVYVDESTFTVKINSILEGATKIIEVPENHFYMLGDNPAESHDSRYWIIPLFMRMIFWPGCLYSDIKLNG